jgi:hypothetical protein
VFTLDRASEALYHAGTAQLLTRLKVTQVIGTSSK